MLSKQKGLTLIEVLIGLFIFTVVSLVNGRVLLDMLKLQKESNVQTVIIDELSSRLQEAVINPLTPADVCSGVNSTGFSIDGISYAVACDVEKIDKFSINKEWPVIAASEDADTAQDCASGLSSNNCFIIGR